MGSSYRQIYLHIIWATYKRLEIIDEELETYLIELFVAKLNELDCKLIAVGCASDHVHILIDHHPSVSISKLVGELKGYSSYMIANKIFPDCGFRWQRGYRVMSVSRSELTRLAKYINNQREHHK
jgi:REP element-mobilizing transposase RayT